jgi:alpha-D-ribose 1-methylphosphonate 5-triphosphate synthase subunit PhnL
LATDRRPDRQSQSQSIFQRENLVLNNVDFTVNAGEFVYLVGRTGSGKSSLMRTLYGDLPLVEGEGVVRLRPPEIETLGKCPTSAARSASCSRTSSCWATAT